MKTTCKTTILLLAFIAIAATGCSGAKGPTVPDEAFRLGQGFDLNNDKYIVFDGRYKDVDLSTLRAYDSGDPSLLGGSYWVAAITLDQESGAGGTVHIPRYRWLENDELGPDGVPDGLTEGTYTYQLPKVDACHFDSEDLVELAVCYMWKDLGDQTPIWGVGVTISSWEEQDFPDEDPFTTTTVQWEPGVLTVYEPDLAYDFDTGDIYLTYVKLVDDDYPRRLYYKRYDHEGETWCAQQPLWTSGAKHDAYNPRIDVGLVTNMPGHEGTCNMVGIVYSGIGYDDDPDRDLYAVYWETSEADNVSKWDDHWELKSDGVYLPHIDIAPDSNGKHYYAVVYQRRVTGQNYNHAVYEIDNIHNTPVRVTRHDDEDAYQPTIAVHYDSSTSWPDKYASIGLFEYKEDLDNYCWCMLIKLNDGYYDDIDFFELDREVVGLWGTDVPPATFLGVATAIIDKTDNYLWVGWRDSLFASGAGDVLAAYGNPVPEE